MEQFTASEVRDAITWKYGDKLTRISAMLTAYADLLEAQERAVPVMIVNHVSSAEHDLPIGMKLYTHPSPSDAEKRETMTPRELAKRIERGEKWKLADEPAPCQSQNAERLAEALRMCMDIMLEHGVPIHPDADARVAYTAAEQALAAHSTQAQPPAQSKYAPPYPDQSDEWAVVPRVPTKAMVDACCKIKLDRLEALRDGHGASSGIVAAVQEEWAAMIAAAPRKRHDTINLLEDSTAQPPAASVPGVSAQAHENAQAALAAQENPNG